MPCDSIILNQVDLNLVNRELLIDALKGMKGVRNVQVYSDEIYFNAHGVDYSIANGKLTCPEGKEGMADTVKQAYSREAVKLAAEQYAFLLEVDEEDSTGNSMVMTKEYE